LVNDNLKDGKLAQQREELLQLIETIRNSLDDPASSDTCSNSTASDGEDSIEESIVSLQARNGCLRDLSVSLEHPAPDATVVEETGATTAEPFHVTGPALMWTRRILDGFPNIDVQLSGRLGHANWDRFQRISKQMESIGDLSSESENEEEEVEEEECDYSHGPSLFSKSTGGDDSIFSRPRQSTGYGGTIATSVSERRLEYSFPAARKRPLAKDLRSQATYTSTMTDDRGERGWLRIPSLPIKEEQLGSPFRCTICGEKLHEIFNRTDWKCDPSSPMSSFDADVLTESMCLRIWSLTSVHFQNVTWD
jgi:hypothetical protein